MLVAAVVVFLPPLFPTFHVPSLSMCPSLLPGDYIVVSRFTAEAPARGDVLIFHWPVHPPQLFLQRLVGLPGDHVVVDGRKVYINGSLINGSLLPVTPDQPEPLAWELYFHEQLGRHNHGIRQLADFQGNHPDMAYTNVVVPPGRYFMMGDNRNESDDSRFWGFLPEDNVVGKVSSVWMHREPGLHLPSFGRNGIVN